MTPESLVNRAKLIVGAVDYGLSHGHPLEEIDRDIQMAIMFSGLATAMYCQIAVEEEDD